ncbi:hypothetical protein B0H16DRAFT_1695796 [Mycena metata]|uniref:Uncharacterized protein n=1 Tax=Mycena metata TaxID=1033252 RepID=A0AAD7MXC5_9AGAR|nr:hypothetical protein B0H16DRAFT_1695796 [Mycena metata]
MIVNKLKVLGGGLGGRGGAAGVTGRRGGDGKGPQLAAETAMFWDGNIVGGFGGTGGPGKYLGGTGGLGDVVDTALDMPIKEFCEKYKISQDLLARLEKEGFTTVGALLEAMNFQLEDKEFGLGNIAELKRALKQYISCFPPRQETNMQQF